MIASHSIAQAALARDTVVNAGYANCPTWAEVAAGKRPPQQFEAEVGEWGHG